jgi:type I site-specific restriction endonuclease
MLKNTNLRYEVIYKNLLRDFRKFFILDFNQTTEYIKKKRRQEPRFYIHCLRQYLLEKNIKLEKSDFQEGSASPAKNMQKNSDDIDQRKESINSMQALVFALGSLVYPKEMLKELSMSGEILLPANYSIGDTIHS